MFLKESTSIGLRVLLYLGSHKNPGPARVPALTDIVNSSKSTMHKLLKFMVKQGWIVSHRGRYGGYELDERVLDVGLGTIVEILEKDRHVIDCTKMECPFRNTLCPFIEPMDAASTQFYKELNHTTVRDLIEKRLSIEHNSTQIIKLKKSRS